MPDLRPLLLFSLALIAAGCRGYAQPTCPDVERAGSDLGVCSTDQQQCCTPNQITSRLATAIQLLRRGLSLQMNITNSQISEIVGSIVNNINVILRQEWIASRSLPNPGGLFTDRQYNESYESLINNLADDLLNTDLTPNSASQFVDNIIEAFQNSAANLLAHDNGTLRHCVLDGIANSVDQTAKENMVRLIENVGKSITSLIIMEQFFRNYTTDTNFSLPRNCAEQLVKLSFCRQCIEKIPPLCNRTCSALAYGCYAPYSDAWTTEYDLFRNVSIQVLTILNETLGTLLSDENRLFQEETLKQSIHDCGGSFPDQSLINGANTTMLIPQERKRELNTLISGRGLSYGVGGPLICQPVVTPQACIDSSLPSQTRDNCTADRICTSSCRCFDGKMTLTNDEVEKFSTTGIEGQSQNPAFENLDISELKMIRNSVGKPVRAFLTRPEIRAVFPPGVVIPPETVNDNDPKNVASFNLPTTLIVISLMLMTIVLL